MTQRLTVEDGDHSPSPLPLSESSFPPKGTASILNTREAQTYSPCGSCDLRRHSLGDKICRADVVVLCSYISARSECTLFSSNDPTGTIDYDQRYSSGRGTTSTAQIHLLRACDAGNRQMFRQCRRRSGTASKFPPFDVVL